MRKTLCTLLLAALAALPASAQELRTAYFMQNAQYKHELNPALLDGPYVSMPLFFGYMNVGTEGNLGLKKLVYKMEPGWQGYNVGGRTLTTFLHPQVDSGDFLGSLRERNTLGVHLKYTLLGVAFKGFKGNNLIELNLRSNTTASVPKSLFDFMKNAGAKDEYKLGNIGLRSESYMEIALGHQHNIGDKLSIGAKMKFLLGLAYADLDVKKLDVRLADDRWSVDGDATLSAAVLSSDFKYKDDDFDPATGRRRVEGVDNISGGLAGAGVAFDLGATYKVLPDLTVSAALTDLGFINWKGVKKGSSKAEWSFEGFKKDIYTGGGNEDGNKLSDQFDAIGDDLEDLFAVYDDGEGKESRALAATLNIGADYTLPVWGGRIHTGFLYSSRIQGRYSWHQGMFSATVRPVKCLEVGASVGFTSAGVTGGLMLDLRAKHFNFFVGTDRIMGKVSKEGIPLNSSNANIAVGISFPM